ncbi:invasion associated locus B family protein [Bradyrhizobium tropiciagri]|uniref:invasion associated locus B family protein n=1 Tax=Bradyrhizobium tropiciagri TaxID=312253 RepID=UPI001BA64FEF|nr:invasion associated locus B family protein [Bradyrhizobium tropiciagri]MBR0872078.1 invasion associated locus B family protein [Bradyrhizobium tropiciagri]
MRHLVVLLGSLAAQFALGGIGEAADPRATQLTYEPWTKVCLTQASCFVGAAARGQCSPSGGTISVSPQNSKRAILSANVGTRTMLEGTISLRIDQDEPIQIAKPHCYTLGCGGTLEANSELIERLKHAQTITVEATNLTGQKISLAFPLTHFAETFDGPGSETKVLEKSAQELKEAQQRAASFKQLPQCEN